MRPEARQRLFEGDRQQRLEGDLHQVGMRHSRAPFEIPRAYGSQPRPAFEQLASAAPAMSALGGMRKSALYCLPYSGGSTAMRSMPGWRPA